MVDGSRSGGGMRVGVGVFQDLQVMLTGTKALALLVQKYKY
jgi:hypothetical protein